MGVTRAVSRRSRGEETRGSRPAGDAGTADMAGGDRRARRAAARAGARQRLRTFAPEPDGHRRRVCAFLQRAVRADRPAVVRPRRVLRPRRLRRHPCDARDQSWPSAADALGAARRRRRRIAVRPLVRCADDTARGHHLRADLARRRGTRLRRDLHDAGLLRRRGRHHRESHPRARRCSASISGRSSPSTISSRCGRCSQRRSCGPSRAPRWDGCALRSGTTPSARSSWVTTRTASASLRLPSRALFAGLAGGLHAINYEIVAADAVSAQRSGTVLLMTYIGGAGHFAGPILGAVTLTWLQTSLSGYTSAWLLYIGLFFVLTILFAPSGLVGLDPDAWPDRPHPGLSRCAPGLRDCAPARGGHGVRRSAADRDELPAGDPARARQPHATCSVSRSTPRRRGRGSPRE